MKKFVFCGILGCFSMLSSAQTKSEVKLNMLNTILRASVEVGYEYFTTPNSSIGIEALINDRFSYYPEDKNEEFNTNSVQLAYHFYFSEGSKTYIFPFVKYRFGDYEEVVDGTLLKTDMDSFILGLGAGYKWVWNGQFAFGPYANIARNFSEEVNERFAAVEINAGISVGYRF